PRPLASFPPRRSSDLSVPRLVARAADAEIAEALDAAGRRADVVVTFPWDDDPNRTPQLAPDSAGAIESMRMDVAADVPAALADVDRKSTRLNSSHVKI